ncbi:armadillo-type protein [Dipodascopsis uninucleata]
MLASSDANVQFFGALTYTVKINNDWQSIPANGINDLIKQLLHWILMHQHGPKFAVKKLLATIALVLLKFPKEWKFPVQDFILCIGYKQVMSNLTDDQTITEVSSALSRMSIDDLQTICIFCSTLSEEISKPDTPRADRPSLNDVLMNNTEHVISVIRPILDLNNRSLTEMYPLVINALNCLRSWTLAAVYFDANSAAVRQLASLVPMVLSWIEVDSNDDLFSTTTEVMMDFMDWADKLILNPTMLTMVDIFSGPWCEARVAKVFEEGNSDDINSSFLNIFVAFSELVAKEISQNLSQPQIQKIVGLMLRLISIPGYEQDHINVAKRTLEFWDLFVDSILFDSDGSLLLSKNNDNESGDDAVKSANEQNIDASVIMMQVIQNVWSKVRVPSGGVIARWPSDAREEFFAFRKDVSDLIENSYQLVRPQLFQMLIEHIVQEMKKPNQIEWESVEASLFCLNAIQIGLSGEPEEYLIFKALLDTDFLDVLSKVEVLRVRQTSITLLSSYLSFFEAESGIPYIPKVVGYLFTCLSSPSLSIASAKAIYQLCVTCAADKLKDDVDIFLRIYDDMLTHAVTVEPIVNEKIAGAIAAIIKEQNDAQAIYEYLDRLVDSVISYGQRTLSQFNSNAEEIEETRDSAWSALRALAQIGKTGRDAEERLSALNGDEYKQKLDLERNFWENGPGLSLREKVFAFVMWVGTGVDILAGDLTTRQIVCQVLTSGFSGSNSDPFYWPINVLIQYIQIEVFQIGRLETLRPVFNLAGRLVAVRLSDLDQDPKGSCREILSILYEGVIMKNVSNDVSTFDPDVNLGMLEFLERLVAKYVDILLSYIHAERIFEMALVMLLSKEPLVVRACVKFWTGFITCEGSSRHRIEGNKGEISQTIQKYVHHIGPSLMRKIVWAISGQSVRSLVSDYASLLKILFREHSGYAKQWLSTCIEEQASVQATAFKVSETDRRQFVEKVFRLRGRPPTETVIKDFWIQCRGQEFDYLG